MTNYDIAKKFLDNPHGYYRNKRSNVSYDDGIFYSYSTAIAKITKDINGENVLLIGNDIISFHNFSKNISKHRDLIICLANKSGLKIYEAPQICKNIDFYPDWIIKEITAKLILLKRFDTLTIHYKDQICQIYNILLNFRELKDFQERLQDINALLDQYKDLYTFARDYKRGK